MKLLILQALISDGKKVIYQHLKDLFCQDNCDQDMSRFYFNFVYMFPYLNLDTLEEKYREDKSNIIGMIEDIYPMILSGDYVNYSDYLADSQ